MIGAKKGMEEIAVEIKSFSGASEVDQFEDALGQFLVYRPALTKKEPNRILFLSMSKDFYDNLFDDAYFIELADLYDLKRLVYDPISNEIILWKK